MGCMSKPAFARTLANGRGAGVRTLACSSIRVVVGAFGTGGLFEDRVVEIKQRTRIGGGWLENHPKLYGSIPLCVGIFHENFDPLFGAFMGTYWILAHFVTQVAYLPLTIHLLLPYGFNAQWIYPSRVVKSKLVWPPTDFHELTHVYKPFIPR